MNTKKFMGVGLALLWAVAAWGYQLNDFRFEKGANVSSATVAYWSNGGYNAQTNLLNASGQIGFGAVNCGTKPICVTQIATPNDNGYQGKWRGVMQNLTSGVVTTNGPFLAGAEFTPPESSDGRILTLEVYAEPRVFDIAYEPNGGSIRDSRYSREYTAYTFGTGVTLPSPVERSPMDEYSFQGWFANANLTGSPVTAVGAAEYGNKTFYAKWATNSHTIVGVASPVSGGTVTGAGSCLYGTTATLTAVPSLGWHFQHWSDDVNALAWRQVTVTRDAQYTAEFVQDEYTITFDKQGGVGGSESVKIHYGDEPGSIVVPERVGYTLGGYFSAAGGKGTQFYKGDGSRAGATWNTTADGTLYAYWRGNPYTIRFDGAGATGTVSNLSAEYGTPVSLPACTFGKAGYTFAGWATDNVTKTVVFADKARVSNLTTTKDATVTLYAVWRAGKYYVAFDANGGTGEMPVQEFTYDTATNLTANAFTRHGYDFYGWATQATTNLEDVVYDDGNALSNLTDRVDSTNFFYAVWGPERLVVTLDADEAKGGYWETNTYSAVTNVQVVYGAAWNLPTPESTDSTLTFVRWRMKKGDDYYALPEKVPTRANGVTNLVAQWASSLSAALDAPDLEFAVGSAGVDAAWHTQSNVFNYAGSAAQGGYGALIISNPAKDEVTHSYAWMSMEVPTNGVLSFDWRLDSPSAEIINKVPSGNILYFVTNVTAVSKYTTPVLALTNLEGQVSTEWRSSVWTNTSDVACEVAWAFLQTGYARNCGGTGWVDHVVLTTGTSPADCNVMLPVDLENVTAAWTSGDGSVTNAIENAPFSVPYGTEGLKVIFTAGSGFEFEGGQVAVAYDGFDSPLTENIIVGEECIPALQKALRTVTLPADLGKLIVAGYLVEDESTTNKLEGTSFDVPRGAANVRIIFTPVEGYEFAPGASPVYACASPIVTNLTLTAADLPAVVKTPEVTLPTSLGNLTAAYVYGAGAVTNAVAAGATFSLPYGTEGLKIIFTPVSGYVLAPGASAVYTGPSPLTNDITLTAADLPAVVAVRTVTLPTNLGNLTASWTSGDGTVTNALAGSSFTVLDGTTGVKVIFTPAAGYEFAPGAQAVYACPSPISGHVTVTAADLPQVVSAICTVTLPADIGNLTVVGYQMAGDPATRALTGNAFTVPRGATGVKIVFAPAEGYEFADGASAVYACPSPLLTDVALSARDLPAVVKVVPPVVDPALSDTADAGLPATCVAANAAGSYVCWLTNTAGQVVATAVCKLGKPAKKTGLCKVTVKIANALTGKSVSAKGQGTAVADEPLAVTLTGKATGDLIFQGDCAVGQVTLDGVAYGVAGGRVADKKLDATGKYAQVAKLAGAWTAVCGPAAADRATVALQIKNTGAASAKIVFADGKTLSVSTFVLMGANGWAVVPMAVAKVQRGVAQALGALYWIKLDSREAQLRGHGRDVALAAAARLSKNDMKAAAEDLKVYDEAFAELPQEKAKLSYTASNGLIKGSFKASFTDARGRQAMKTVKVFAVDVGGEVVGWAYLKNFFSGFVGEDSLWE
ncbi:MAG: InlB B-repeat-containing protein [Kiritimatiellae bacterium]|nr:InlB B-repeat-containing protein [Kiritimatiellia bacterium]